MLYTFNPNKFRCAASLVKHHRKKGDKVILFSDNVAALKNYAALLKIPFIYGGTKEVHCTALWRSTWTGVCVMPARERCEFIRIWRTHQSFVSDPHLAPSQSDRARVFSSFRSSASVNVVAVSKVGDVAIGIVHSPCEAQTPANTSSDLPEANVIIQISSQYGSRRQEAQRLGR